MKKSKKWLEQEATLKAEGMVLLAKTEILKEAAEANYQKMEAVNEKGFDELPWDEKEKAIEYFTKLLEKIERSARELAALDEQYAELRVRVNKFYGKNVMKEFNSVIPDNLDEEEEDPADWWRKS